MSTLTISIPWAVLCPDNRRVGVMRGRVLLTREYRAAKQAATALLWAATVGLRPLTGPVRLAVALHEPDARRRDLLNYAKLLGDALEAAGVLLDDTQLADVAFRRAGIDRAHPRAVLTLEELEP